MAIKFWRLSQSLLIKQPGKVSQYKCFKLQEKRRGGGGLKSQTLLVFPPRVGSVEILPVGNLTSVYLYLISSFTHQLCLNHFLCIFFFQPSSGCWEIPVFFVHVFNLFS